ncbi:hypothetical protein GGS21DRAFT_547234 [Xylaria nigripes]|nr:hypothetical protein GGS21DRAFT_547234 [Xylaria nigripes]
MLFENLLRNHSLWHLNVPTNVAGKLSDVILMILHTSIATFLSPLPTDPYYQDLPILENNASDTNSGAISHLLGKKSWNVYNPANIARVKRDEAEAQARNEAESRRQQDLDAERRLAILRGEVPPPLPDPSSTEPSSAPGTHQKRGRDDDDSTGRFRGGERRKRKRFGEDDTDFEMRMARERTDAAASGAASGAAIRLSNSTKTSNAPLVDSKGHIALFPQNDTDVGASRNQKNEEAEREAAEKRRDFEDQYTMRFANAGGRNNGGVTGSGPWYASNGARDLRGSADIRDQAPGKDVWGNEDPKRKAREAARVASNDPLAMMKKGAAKVRDVERERRTLNEEKARELKQLRREEKRHEKRRSRHNDPNELEGFNLDAQPANDDDGRDERKEHRHRRRSDHDNHHHRHHRHHEHEHEKRDSHSGHGRDSGERERHSSGHGRRQLMRTDHY